jgi:chemotaxis protein MotA
MEKGSMIGLGLCLAGVFISATMHGINIAFLFMEFGSVLTNRARAEGLLALEEEAKGIEEPFFRKGIELAVDGTDPDALKKTLNAEIGAMKERHKVGQGWFTSAGVFAPTFGIIGAVFGLMATMAQLSHPEKVGEGIAGAFVATFWGVFLANGVWLPWANKLKQLSLAEVAHKQLIVEGIMAIQAGVSPRVVEELLKSHVPPSERDKAVPPAATQSGGGQAAAAA